MPNLNQLATLVKDAGLQLMQWRDQKMFDGVAIGHDFKAEVDKQAHTFLAEGLHAIDATIPVISEEDAASLVHERPVQYWLIDPLDGTSSFVKGFSGFVTQAALIENQQPAMSAVCAPMFDELFYAQKGCGAYLNGNRLQLNSDRQATILIDNTPSPRASAAKIYDQLGFTGYVECGSIGLKICRVAGGSADLFFKDVTVRDWDIAAPMLILQEAGGCVMRLDGRSFLFENSYEHDGLVASLNERECGRVVNFFGENRGLI